MFGMILNLFLVRMDAIYEVEGDNHATTQHGAHAPEKLVYMQNLSHVRMGVPELLNDRRRQR